MTVGSVFGHFRAEEWRSVASYVLCGCSQCEFHTRQCGSACCIAFAAPEFRACVLSWV